MGARAVELLLEGVANKAVGVRGKNIIDMDLGEALSIKKTFDMDSYELANVLSI